MWLTCYSQIVKKGNNWFSSSGHECSFPGCKNVLVIDGNMKNRRDVCAASEAGFIEYDSLPGMIKTGCQLSPGYQSRYCYNHAPRVSRQAVEGKAQQEEGIVQLITAKKQTRGAIYSQVCMYCVSLGVCMYMYMWGHMLYFSGSMVWMWWKDDVGTCIITTSDTDQRIWRRCGLQGECCNRPQLRSDDPYSGGDQVQCIRTSTCKAS